MKRDPRRALSDRAGTIVVSCEHASRRVPREFRSRFAGEESVLGTHRASDLGALAFARALAKQFGVPLFATSVTRLLVDANRSESNPRIWSEFSRDLPPAVRERLLDRYHRPHRAAVARAVSRATESGRRVVHLAVHSFTPVWNGLPRTADVGLLYDPSRFGERRLADLLHEALLEDLPALRVRRNQPYRGRDDGLPTTLRRIHGPMEYVGLELELSQGLLAASPRSGRRIRTVLESVVQDLVAGPADGPRRVAPPSGRVRR